VDNGIVYVCSESSDSDCLKLEENYLPEYSSTEARCGKTEFKVEN
jgi:hypothetical protein